MNRIFILKHIYRRRGCRLLRDWVTLPAKSISSHTIPSNLTNIILQCRSGEASRKRLSFPKKHEHETEERLQGENATHITPVLDGCVESLLRIGVK